MTYECFKTRYLGKKIRTKTRKIAYIIDYDDLSAIGSYPDRWTIQYLDGSEEDCTREFFIILNK
jgi:hypothetical protein